MRVAVFIDGRDFYAGWRASERPSLRFPALAEWLVSQTGGTELWGAYYYTAYNDGLTPGAGDAQRAYLDTLASQPGFFVRGFPTRSYRGSCPACGEPMRGRRDIEAATTLVADAIHHAASNTYDTLVLVSRDSVLLPAMLGVQALGKRVHLATWGDAGLSRRLRRVAYDHLDLRAGLPRFADENGDAPDAVSFPAAFDARLGDPSPDADETTEGALAHFVQEVRRAQERFDEGYVGLHYFLTRWKSDFLDTAADTRRALLDGTITAGLVEVYEAPDGAKAVRVCPPTD